jgi:hypothetical protein
MSTIAQVKELLHYVLGPRADELREKRTLCVGNATWMDQILYTGWCLDTCTRPMPPRKTWPRSKDVERWISARQDCANALPNQPPR